MIGPHEGKELDLMLAGKKHLAVFYDALRPGVTTSEDIIPEAAFSIHVKNGLLLRFEETFTTSKDNTIRYVCFTTPREAWRANAFFWLKRETFEGKRPFDDAYEYFIGRLLSYSEEEIKNFLEHRKNLLLKAV